MRCSMAVERPSIWIVAACALGVVYFTGSEAKWYAPTVFSPHRGFYRRCADIPPGVEPHAVVNAMRGYVLARREGSRIVDDAIVDMAPQPTTDKGGSTVFLFYPNQKDTADWCVVRFREGRVSSVALEPD
jgi:hypothetical protein